MSADSLSSERGASSQAAPSLSDWLRDYHASHDCNPGPCTCKCGCTQQMGCRDLSKLCSTCHVRYVRDDDDHGPGTPSDTEG